ncbi:MAG: Asp-tRNA(Asn)/Glu-tRNA(Gln) amidotransferase subunit GatB [Xanthomonadaceae bacterium]|nr:Asp-tRNA(Asn)/Glu-tRNA(Gln) amidotransferase subunit GatB [Xanthomonadaceae bacterium]MDE1885344.1 Asp-tRNA(Asn)/Glu-tRNA(Gln) amidotransferase subunit GatB [Xanthomonadaceae bacterium]MDE1961543.1 Asp-tRNA(Asn)/Glu-tRNA(Gln) amidotransferase subunit GatB [Xanthomonadaceae bacterium]MDE2083438.1 Asp-tRNA(Asn)/Glu-tRNA(Gln) amidotransferase subunit GatB [Xanthomonadaceae bacterium]MDE2257766.1 Asp-tRNA(Asn)/Glu-tRNA(Gln) amidotransferase subunit GatB [Xanthomonadaceae bacterium]
MSWQSVIGLEIHAQLCTASKLFSGASTAYGAEPNTQASLVDVAMPGTLPVPNRAALDKAIAFGLAVNATIARHSVFARKNYFYSDLPKGYQISQYELPIVSAGALAVRLQNGRSIDVEIQRAHLEEDAGKSLHDAFHAATGLDFNRAGVPLLEIVSAPVLHSAQDAVAYLRTVHTLVRWLGICDGNMAEGSFRCDANVSVRRTGTQKLGTRTEIKNVNSFRFVEKAIEYEIERQIRALENGETLVQETRLYDAAAHRTLPMRSKEDADDYRYFPDPDLPPLAVTDADIAAVRAALPELPDARRKRYIEGLGLPDSDATQLCADKATADYFEAMLGALPGQAKTCANWVLGELAAALNAQNLAMESTRISAPMLAGLVARIADGTISGKTAKDVFAAMWAGEGDADAIVAARGLQQISDTGAITAAVDAVIAQFPMQLADYRTGNEKLLQFFVGQAMKRLRGQANPQQLNALLRDKLRSD